MKKPDLSLPLYKHEKRPEWGMALLAWERDGRRGYLFEDGDLRVIAEPYYKWMKLSQADAGELTQTFQRHLSQMQLSDTEDLLNPNRNSDPLFTIDEQAQLLVGQFPEGFAGETWRKRHRGQPGKKRLKRHRDAAVAHAQKMLARERLAQAASDNQYVEVWKDICDLLRHTDVVAPSDVKTLEGRVEQAGRSLTQALTEVLHGDEAQPFGARFDTFVSELKRLLGVVPSWPLATSLPALYHPSTRLCVHPSSVRQQGKWMKEKTLHSKNPNATDYERACNLARRVTEHLERVGTKPTDLLDVHDFMRTTTTPSSRKRLAALRQSDLGDMMTRGAAGSDDDPSDETAEDKEAA